MPKMETLMKKILFLLLFCLLGTQQLQAAAGARPDPLVDIRPFEHMTPRQIYYYGIGYFEANDIARFKAIVPRFLSPTYQMDNVNPPTLREWILFRSEEH